jgi:hypothetical protein
MTTDTASPQKSKIAYDDDYVTFSRDQIGEMLGYLRDAHEVLTTGKSGKGGTTPEQMARMQITAVIRILTCEDDDGDDVG